MLLDACSQHPHHTVVALVTLRRHVTRTRHKVALGVVVLVQVQLEILEARVAVEPGIPVGVGLDALCGTLEDALVALVVHLSGFASGPKLGFVHHFFVAGIRASLLCRL